MFSAEFLGGHKEGKYRSWEKANFLGEKHMTSNYSYQFTALRGLQAGRSFYTIMCPMKLVPRIFIFDEEELDPSLRAQRTINRTRVPEIARYIVANPEEYVFSSITASVNSSVEFDPLVERNREIGTLKIPMTATFVVNDGQQGRCLCQSVLLRPCVILGAHLRPGDVHEANLW